MKIIKELKQIGLRIKQSNNRTLATLIGCMLGLALGIVIVIQHQGSIPVVGNPLTVFYQIVGAAIAMGVGGNLSSYIGASIDLITGEKTFFDLFDYLYRCCKKKPKPTTEAKAEEVELEQPAQPKKHLHFPFITSSDQVPNIHAGTDHYVEEQPSPAANEPPTSSDAHILSRLGVEGGTDEIAHLKETIADKEDTIAQQEVTLRNRLTKIRKLERENRELKKQIGAEVSEEGEKEIITQSISPT